MPTSTQFCRVFQNGKLGYLKFPPASFSRLQHCRYNYIKFPLLWFSLWYHSNADFFRMMMPFLWCGIILAKEPVYLIPIFGFSSDGILKIVGQLANFCLSLDHLSASRTMESQDSGYENKTFVLEVWKNIL